MKYPMTVARPVVLFMLAIIANVSCAGEEATDLTQLQWLAGDWIAVQGETTITEHWRMVSPKTLEGVGHTRKSEKESIETLRLVQMGDDIYYIAKVDHNALPVAFRLLPGNANRLVFSNPGHDFPKQIVYEHSGDSLTVTVSDGAEKGFAIGFKRLSVNPADATP